MIPRSALIAVSRDIATFGLIFFFISISGCGSTVERGSLSEAIEKSSDKYNGERRVEDSKQVPRYDEEHDTADGSPGSPVDRSRSGGDDTLYSSYSSPASGTAWIVLPGRNYVGFRLQTSNRFSNDYTNSSGAALTLVNRYGRKKAIDLTLHIEAITTDEQSKLFGSLGRLADIGIGCHGRRYSTPGHTLMGLFFTYGLDLDFLVWTYRNPVYSHVANGTGDVIAIDTIRMDGVPGLGGTFGGGWSLLQRKGLILSIEAFAGGTLFWFRTFQGFKNDMFIVDASIRAAAELLFGNRRNGW